MRFYVDAHIHSKYSRATSRNLDLENISLWANKKGIQVVGTGDFTHPAWINEIKTKLIPAEPGLFRLLPTIEKAIAAQLTTYTPTRFMLTVEISTIYKKGDKTRKIHHVVYAENIAAAEKIISALSKIGNLTADGRPILGLDSRNLLEIVLAAGKDNYIVPAHIWTPWFAVLGSKSGFDTIDECYGDLASHIFAAETGLSSDPEMNWRVSTLDRYRLISNSDAHSPAKLGREVTLFDSSMDYFAIKNALMTGNGYVGTVEFFPEEGKYHLDGHRKCNLCLEPEETLKYNGICPVCGDPVTIGVSHRINALADRKSENLTPPATAGQVTSLVPLAEIISEIKQKGVNTKTVQTDYEILLTKLGPELEILQAVPLEDIKQQHSTLLQEAISRLRARKVIRHAGFDGEYGVIKLFEPGELEQKYHGAMLFAEPAKKSAPKAATNISNTISAKQKPDNLTKKTKKKEHNSVDPEQQQAIQLTNGPLLIVAGPGSGKTRTLTHRIAYMVTEKNIAPENILAVTFTKRAAHEMQERLKLLLPKAYKKLAIHTLHSLCFTILQQHFAKVGLAENFSIGDNVEFDDLITLTIKLFNEHADILHYYQKQFAYISIDEYQDIDASQYQLLKLLAQHENLCAIGDPNQAIYAFRGGDASFFNNFSIDYPQAKTINLKCNYRSTQTIVKASNQTITTDAIAMLKDAGDKINLHVAKTDKAEAEFAVKTIEQLIGGHNFFALDSGRSKGQSSNYSFADFAILYRTKKQAELLCDAFKRSGMPFVNYSTESLLSKEETKTILAQIQNDNATDLKTQLDTLTMKDKNALAQLKTFAALVDYNKEKFFTEISLANEADTIDPRGDYISLMTLHAAKGLEFKVVFMVGLEDGIMPFYFGNKKNADLAEEQRLFYVGMTRAEEKLYLTRAETRLIFGKIKQQAASPFLTKIEQQLLELSKTDLKPQKPKPTHEQLSLWD
ncbi:MAG: UvrD-helicase domain-containing protein [Gammaproteobacteria bacterium]|nr:UvrD-helicase domain-containing protein [Gammaproteobacteria bacterium]